MPRRVTIPLSEHFWSKVDAQGNCWLWTGHIKANGYGQFMLLRPGVRATYAHRMAWQLLIGPIPWWLELDHLCRVRHCVNPDHMRLVDHRTNLLAGYGVVGKANRERKTYA